MTKIILYLIFILFCLVSFVGSIFLNQIPNELNPAKTILACAATGGIGGCIYCLRAVYLNACVRMHWDENWHPWYYIRPIVSVVCGAVSYLFLRAGLLILESGTKIESTDLGFYSLAFIAGLNVDKFISKIEDVAQAVWGIEKSRTSSEKSDS